MPCVGTQLKDGSCVDPAPCVSASFQGKSRVDPQSFVGTTKKGLSGDGPFVGRAPFVVNGPYVGQEPFVGKRFVGAPKDSPVLIQSEAESASRGELRIWLAQRIAP